MRQKKKQFNSSKTSWTSTDTSVVSGKLSQIMEFNFSIILQTIKENYTKTSSSNSSITKELCTSCADINIPNRMENKRNGSIHMSVIERGSQPCKNSFCGIMKCDITKA